MRPRCRVALKVWVALQDKHKYIGMLRRQKLLEAEQALQDAGGGPAEQRKVRIAALLITGVETNAEYVDGTDDDTLRRYNTQAAALVNSAGALGRWFSLVF